MGNYTIAVLVGWAIAVWALGSVLFADPANFTNLGTSKGRWFLIELTALIPYVGFIAALVYLFKIRVHFPPRPRQPRPPRPASGPYGGSAPSSPPGSPGWGQPQNSPSWQPPQKQRCGVCNGGTNPCTSCSGGYVYGSRTQRCGVCGGSGQRKCAMCGGSGYR